MTRPDYYRIRIPTGIGDRFIEIDPADIILALDLSFFKGNALKYVVRAGRKTASELEDLRKARDNLDTEIKALERVQTASQAAVDPLPF